MPLTRRARILLGILGTVILLAGGVLLFLSRRGDALLNATAERWLSARLAALSDSVYTARVHNLHYVTTSRSIRFDSVSITTDVRRNQARAQPMPTLLLTVKGGRITGIDPWELGSRRLSVGEVGYDGVDLLVTLPPLFRSDTTAEAPAPDTTAPAKRPVLIAIGPDRPPVSEGERTAFVRSVRFGKLTGTLTVPFEGGPRDFDLEGFSAELDSVSFDLRKDATTPFRASDARVAAGAFAGRVGANDELSFGRLALSVADSTLKVDSLRLVPPEGDTAFFRSRQYRATRTIVGFDRLEAAGVDWVGLILGTRVAVRRLAIDGFLLDLLLDKRKPANPVRNPKPSPQARLAAIRSPLAIDSVLVRNGTVRYAERVATAAAPGTLHFDGIDAALTNVTNDSTRQTDSTPARIEASARFMDKGPLQAVIEFPLLAPDYRADFRATLGRMPAAALNEVLTPLVGVELTEGTLDRVRIDARVRRGVYAGTLTPEFRDLHVKLTQTVQEKREEKGVKGFFKGAVRDAKAVAANTFVRDDNPEKPGKPVRSGRITYARTPTDSFWSGIWKALKPALAETMVSIKL